MSADDFEEGAALCICCEEAPATKDDRSQGGKVCGFCKTLLDAADVILKKVPYLGGWQPIARGGVQR